MLTFYEFFAGAGMARAGLGAQWECLFANDLDAKKAVSYSKHWGSDHLKVCDIASLTSNDLPGRADLAWASFPCQDLSLAGLGAGLRGSRSGTFWAFWDLMTNLQKEGRSPHTIVLENVCGTLNSHGGRDFASIGQALADGGYRFGAVVIDAKHFLPQSRARLFIVGVAEAADEVISALQNHAPAELWHPPALVKAHNQLSGMASRRWVWWRLPTPSKRKESFSEIVDDEPEGVNWHSAAETERLLGMMSPLNKAKLAKAQRFGRRLVGSVYKRTRPDGHGGKVQRAEIRFDDVAGCLRTPVGGSSRQTIVIVEGHHIRSRLLAPREAARLMGLPKTYVLPTNYNDAYHLAGDGVAVPVVQFLAENLLEPIIHAEPVERAAA